MPPAETEQERITRLFSEAKAAGDTEKMTKIRAVVEAQDAQPASTPTPEPNPEIEAYQNLSPLQKTIAGASNISGGLLEGLVFDVIDAPVNLVNLAAAGVHKLGWTDEQYRETPPTEGFTPLAKAKEFLAGRKVPKGASPTQDAVRTGASWGAGAINPFNPAKKVDLLMGGLAAGGELAAGDEQGQLAGLLPVAGSVVNALRGKVKSAKIPKADRQAVDVIDTVLANTPGAQATLADNLANQEVGTLADLTGSPPAYNLENTLTPPGSEVARQVAEVNRKAELGIIDDVDYTLPDTWGDTSVRAATEHVEAIQARITDRAKTRVAGLEAATGTKAAAATTQEGIDAASIADAQATASALRGQADTAQAPLTEGPLPSEASTKVYLQTKASEIKKREAAKTEWAVFDLSPPVDASGPAKTVQAHVDKTLPEKGGTDYKKFMKAYGEEMKAIEKWRKGPLGGPGNFATPTSIQAVLRDMREKINSAAKGDFKYSDTIASGVVDVLEEALINSPTTKNYANAIKATKRVYDEALPEKIKKAIKSPGKETYAARLGYVGEQGAETARLHKADSDPNTVKISNDYVRARGGVEGVDEKFMAKYGEYLNQFPELKAEMQVLADTKTAAKGAEKSAKGVDTKLSKAIAASEKARADDVTELGKASEEVRAAAKKGRDFASKGVVADFADPKKNTLDGLLNSDEATATDGLTKLMKWATKNDVDQSFKSNVRLALIDKLFPEKHGLRVVSGKAVDEFNKLKPSLIDSGVLTNEDALTIATALAKTSRQEARKVSGKMDLTPKVTPRERVAATMLALGIVSTTGIPHALLVTRLARDGIESEMKLRKLTPAGKARVEEFVVHPEKYADAYKQLQKYERDGKALTKANISRLIRLVIGTGQSIDPEEKPDAT